jgi:hypothetical protein
VEPISQLNHEQPSRAADVRAQQQASRPLSVQGRTPRVRGRTGGAGHKRHVHKKELSDEADATPEGQRPASETASDEDEELDTLVMLQNHALNLKREARSVNKRLNGLGPRTAKQNNRASKAYRKRNQEERELAERHTFLLSQLARTEKDLAMMQALRERELEGADGLRDRKSFTKPPDMSSAPKLYLSADMQETTLLRSFEALERFWNARKFPEKERVRGSLHHRWSNLLPEQLDNKSAQDLLWFDKLCAGQGEPWGVVKEEVLGRFVKILDEFADCKTLDDLHQEEGQSAASYSEAFAQAVERTLAPAEDGTVPQRPIGGQCTPSTPSRC